MADAPSPGPGPEPEEHHEETLRGSFVAVLLMGAFFVACWVGVLAIAMERR